MNERKAAQAAAHLLKLHGEPVDGLFLATPLPTIEATLLPAKLPWWATPEFAPLTTQSDLDDAVAAAEKDYRNDCSTGQVQGL